MENDAGQRTKLWLRAERAMGLSNFLPLPKRRHSEAPPLISPQPASELPTLAALPLAPTPLPLMQPPSIEPFTTEVLSTAEKKRRLLALDNNEVRGCTRCRLCESRTQTVFGEGDVDAQIFFVGEGPGQTEDETGRPFVGRAGEKLNDMIRGMGLRREDVYIANIVKCRPPGNRTPAPDEVATCTPYLQRQIEIVRPRVLVTLGVPATQYMLQRSIAISKVRGVWHEWRGIKLMPTYHPAFILRNYTPATRAAVWSDLKQVMSELGLAIPEKKSADK